MNATLTVAQTILEQLGGRRFQVMTGAKNFIGGENSLSFKVGQNDKRVTHVRITLSAMDLYDAEFLNVRAGAVKLLAKREELYAEDLRGAFEKATGMVTSLGTLGA